MSNLLVFVFAMILVSCSSLEGTYNGEASSPGYQFARQMDEKSMRSGFLER